MSAFVGGKNLSDDTIFRGCPIQIFWELFCGFS